MTLHTTVFIISKDLRVGHQKAPEITVRQDAKYDPEHQ